MEDSLEDEDRPELVCVEIEEDLVADPVVVDRCAVVVWYNVEEDLVADPEEVED